MNYVTTNIRISEKDYLRLKAEAAKRRKSLSAVIREKISSGDEKRTKVEVELLLQELDSLAEKNSKYFKGINIVKVLRSMRYKGKW